MSKIGAEPIGGMESSQLGGLGPSQSRAGAEQIGVEQTWAEDGGVTGNATGPKMEAAKQKGGGVSLDGYDAGALFPGFPITLRRNEARLNYNLQGGVGVKRRWERERERDREGKERERERYREESDIVR